MQDVSVVFVSCSTETVHRDERDDSEKRLQFRDAVQVSEDST